MLEELYKFEPEVAVSVLQSSGMGVQTLLACLPDTLHKAALYSEFSSLQSDGNIVMDCGETSMRSCTAALNALASAPVLWSTETGGITICDTQFQTSDAGQPISDFSDAVYEFLRRCASVLTRVTIQSFKIDDTHLERLMTALAAIPSLRQLRFVNMKMVGKDTVSGILNSDKCMDALAHHLADGLKNLPHLTDLSLNDVFLQGRQATELYCSVIAPSVKHITGLTQLSLGNSFKDAAAHADLLKSLERLSCLELRFHAVKSNDASLLASALQRLTKLTRLELSSISGQGPIGELQAVSIASSICYLRNLIQLDTNGCCWHPAAIHSLSRGIQSMKALEQLSIRLSCNGRATATLCAGIAGSSCTKLKLCTVRVLLRLLNFCEPC